MRIIGVIVLLAVAGWSQNVSSSISGTVVDQSGAVLAGAMVQVVDASNGFERSGVSTEVWGS